MNIKKSQQGIGLIEALIAAIVFAVGIAAVVQLQGKFFKSSSASNARSIATSIAEEKLEDLRGFVSQSTDTANNFYTIADNVGGRCVTGTVSGTSCTRVLSATNYTQGNITFSLSWSVTAYLYNAGALATTTDTDPNAVQKAVTVTVSWTDADNTAQTAAVSTVINKFSGAATTGLLANNVGGSGEKPIVSYTPSTNTRVTPIGVGTDTKRETLVPSSDVVGGYTRTRFTAYTYNNAGKLLREEEFQNVACDCRFNGTSTDASKTNAVAHPEWNTTQDTYVDVEGDKVSGKVQGCVQGGGNNCASNPDDLCNRCCQDHHDISSVSRKYDPFRSSDDFTADGDHKHYLGTTPVTSGQYLEACRLKRVNGTWRVYQDWHMVDLTTLPLSDLIDTTIKATYAGYVKAIIDEYLDENKVAGQDLTSPPAKPSVLDHTVSSNYVTMAVGDFRDLTGRAIYLDYIDSTHLTKVKEKKAAGVDYLLHLPFYEIEVAQVADWNSAVVAALQVGPYNGPGNSNDLYGGQLHALASNSSPVDITGTIRKSNSGIVALSNAVDYNAATNPDSSTHSDDLKVCVGCTTGACALPWGGSIANSATVTAYQAATVPYGSSCASQTRTCSSGSLS
ncbi:MAG: type IV pilus modification PilV family protein, partial [Methylomonas sp.]